MEVEMEMEMEMEKKVGKDVSDEILAVAEEEKEEEMNKSEISVRLLRARVCHLRDIRELLQTPTRVCHLVLVLQKYTLDGFSSTRAETSEQDPKAVSEATPDSFQGENKA